MGFHGRAFARTLRATRLLYLVVTRTRIKFRSLSRDREEYHPPVLDGAPPQDILRSSVKRPAPFREPRLHWARPLHHRVRPDWRRPVRDDDPVPWSAGDLRRSDVRCGPSRRSHSSSPRIATSRRPAASSTCSSACGPRGVTVRRRGRIVQPWPSGLRPTILHDCRPERNPSDSGSGGPRHSTR